MRALERRRAALAALAALATCLLLAGCAAAEAGQPAAGTPEEEFAYVRDWSEPKEPSGMVRIMREMDAKGAQEAAEAAMGEQVDPGPVWEDYGAYSGPYDESLNNNPAYVNGGYPTYGDGFMQQGVREFEGRTETWYSGQAVYTDQLTLDKEGYYRDSEGRYAVAVSDMPEGSEIETSKGTGIVLDSGCDEGVTDFYVSF